MAEVILEQVNKFYSGKTVHAVKDVSMKVADGEFIALLGPSGCGKTSTLRMIAGLEAISAGRIYIGHRIVNNLMPTQRNIAMAFENYGLYPHFTCYDNIAYPLRLRGLARSGIEEKVLQVARLLDVEGILNRKPAQIGAGYQQRISLARALVRDPEVFLLDEPISHLDAELRSRMRGELKRLHRDLGATMIYVTHDQLEAISMADRVAVMDLGELQQVGTASEIYHHPANMFVADFVGQPSMNFMPCNVVSEAGDMYVSLVGDFRLPVPEHYQHVVLGLERKELVLGIRPHEVKVSIKGENAGRLGGVIYIVEPLGDYSLVTVRVDETMVRAIAEPHFPTVHDSPAVLSLDQRRILLFDKESGQELRVMK